MTDAFAPGPSQPAAAPLFSGAALLDAERLDVYRVALEFQAVAGPLIPKLAAIKNAVPARSSYRAIFSVN